MTRHTSQPSFDAYDLNQIFIGREQQLDFFDVYLTRWQQILFNAAPDLDPPVKAPPPPTTNSR